MEKSKQANLVYDKIADSYAGAFSNPSEYIDEFLSLIPKNGKILDVGCGTGVDAGYMQSKGFEVIGIDLSKEMLKLAKERFPQIDFKLADIRKLEFTSNSFNGILASCSLIHIPKDDVRQTLKKFHEILKNNGIIYIALQGGKSEEIFIDEPFKPNEKLFLNVFSLEEIRNLLIWTGFSIDKIHQREPKSEKELKFTKLFIIAKK